MTRSLTFGQSWNLLSAGRQQASQVVWRMTEEESLFCPACETISMLKCGSFDAEVVIDRCPDCHGLWFDAGELRQVLRSEGMKSRLLSAGSPQAGKSSSEPSARQCPRCDRALQQLELGGVTVDVCVGCSGVWLDEGELLKLVGAERQGQLTEDDSAVAYELREGLASGALTPSLLRQLLDALKEWMNR